MKGDIEQTPDLVGLSRYRQLEVMRLKLPSVKLIHAKRRLARVLGRMEKLRVQ